MPIALELFERFQNELLEVSWMWAMTGAKHESQEYKLGFNQKSVQKRVGGARSEDFETQEIPALSAKCKVVIFIWLKRRTSVSKSVNKNRMNFY